MPSARRSYNSIFYEKTIESNHANIEDELIQPCATELNATFKLGIICLHDGTPDKQPLRYANEDTLCHFEDRSLR